VKYSLYDFIFKDTASKLVLCISFSRLHHLCTYLAMVRIYATVFSPSKVCDCQCLHTCKARLLLESHQGNSQLGLSAARWLEPPPRSAPKAICLFYSLRLPATSDMRHSLYCISVLVVHTKLSNCLVTF
jgi:hypothetical protein